MSLRTFVRQFTDNNSYGTYNKALYVDSLAYTVQETIFSDKFMGNACHYSMDGHIKLYDFMTLAIYFIEASISEFGKSTIKDYIEDIRKKKRSYDDSNTVDYVTGGLLLTGASRELIVALLWTTYLYARIRNIGEEDEDWKNAEQMAYALMREESGLRKDYFESLPHVTRFEEAVDMMRKRIVKALEKKVSVKSASEKPQTEVLKAENESLKKQVEELKQEVETLQMEKTMSEAAVEEITSHAKLRLELVLRMMEKDGADVETYGNKVMVAEILRAITNLSPSACKNYCTERDLKVNRHEEEILNLNSKLQALGMSIRL